MSPTPDNPSRPTKFRRAMRLSLACLMLACLLSACQPRETRFEILSFKDGPQSQVFTESFERGFFFVGANNNWHLAFEVAPIYVELEPIAPPPGANPSDDTAPEPTLAKVDDIASAADEDSEHLEHAKVPLRMSQTLSIEVFWRAQPGRTFAESSQTNANIVYCLTAGRESISYEGAGFVSIKLARDKKTLIGRIESSTLYPVRIVGSPANLFGPCRLTGAFVAMEDRARTISLQHSLRRRLGPPLSPERSMTSSN